MRFFLLSILLVSCEPSNSNEWKFKAGDIVSNKLTGEKMIVVGRTNRPFFYSECYDVRNSKGEILERFPEEIEK
jgi:uncharacterized protein YodC (DUF2158 family)